MTPKFVPPLITQFWFCAKAVGNRPPSAQKNALIAILYLDALIVASRNHAFLRIYRRLQGYLNRGCGWWGQPAPYVRIDRLPGTSNLGQEDQHAGDHSQWHHY